MPSEQEEKYFEYSSDIVGIYGQNGSGKTAVIQAMAFIQRLLMGESLPANFADYINKQENECGIRVKFSIESAGKKAVCEYEIKIEKEDLNIKEEILSAAIWNGEKFSKKKNMLKYNRYDEKHEITPIPADKPSKPSIKLMALVIPTIQISVKMFNTTSPFIIALK